MKNLLLFLLLVATATDEGCGVAWVQFYLNGVAVSSKITQPSLDGTYQYTLDTSRLSSGTHYVSAKAADKNGGGICDGTMPNIGSSPIASFTINKPKGNGNGRKR
jgi:hypothetical protein